MPTILARAYPKKDVNKKIQKLRLWKLQATKKWQQNDCGFLLKEVYKMPLPHRKAVWRQESKETKLIPYD